MGRNSARLHRRTDAQTRRRTDNRPRRQRGTGAHRPTETDADTDTDTNANTDRNKTRQTQKQRQTHTCATPAWANKQNNIEKRASAHGPGQSMPGVSSWHLRSPARATSPSNGAATTVAPRLDGNNGQEIKSSCEALDRFWPGRS
eukprot:8539674-Alexandrium_andersonii.AAC.1